MKNYVGRKIRGFRFEDGTDDVYWGEGKEKYNGVIGNIVSQDKNSLMVKFTDTYIFYPISLVEQYLVEEIPQLGEGVLMEVSDNTVNWYKRNIIARLISGYYIDSIFTIWPFARPIPQLPKYTHAELVEKLGHDFEIIK
jgi:hypothetical protein